jgi:hypothetical protein
MNLILGEKRETEDFVLYLTELKAVDDKVFLKTQLKLFKHSEIDWYFIKKKIELIAVVDTITSIYGYTEDWVDVPKGYNPIKLVPYLDYIEFESLKNPDELKQYLINCFEDLKIIKQLC